MEKKETIYGLLEPMLVSFEMAQLAKKHGFEANCYATWYTFGSGRRKPEGNYGETEPELFIDGYNPATGLSIAETEQKYHKFVYFIVNVPIYQQLIDWFRDTHKIKIDVCHSDAVGTTKVTLWRWNHDNNVGKWERIGIIQSYENYYDAARVGLEKAFELL